MDVYDVGWSLDTEGAERALLEAMLQGCYLFCDRRWHWKVTLPRQRRHSSPTHGAAAQREDKGIIMLCNCGCGWREDARSSEALSKRRTRAVLRSRNLCWPFRARLSMVDHRRNFTNPSVPRAINDGMCGMLEYDTSSLTNPAISKKHKWGRTRELRQTTM